MIQVNDGGAFLQGACGEDVKSSYIPDIILKVALNVECE